MTGEADALIIGTAATTTTYIFEPGTTTSLHITTTSLLPGAVKTAYRAPLAASGGTLPYKWSVSSGALPKGLHLKKSTGVISGKPTVSGTYAFTVKVVDKKIKTKHHPPTQNTATKALLIAIS